MEEIIQDIYCKWPGGKWDGIRSHDSYKCLENTSKVIGFLAAFWIVVRMWEKFLWEQWQSWGMVNLVYPTNPTPNEDNLVKAKCWYSNPPSEQNRPLDCSHGGIPELPLPGQGILDRWEEEVKEQSLLWIDILARNWVADLAGTRLKRFPLGLKSIVIWGM